jgi:subtilase family serine protease
VIRRFLFTTVSATALAIAGLAAGPAVASGNTGPSPLHAARLCPTHPASGNASCFAEALVGSSGAAPLASAPPASALTPAQLQDAYTLNGLSSGGATVAIVDAYGYPNLERDLGVFRSTFGLPACTTSNGCLTILDQDGGSSYPASDLGWDGEQALDVDAVSAACPDCKITVVQADTPSFANLGTAVLTASEQPDVVAISNSYGGGDAPDSTYGYYYNHPGIAVTASTGDNGYQGGSYPASSSYVTAVGGTSLFADGSSRGWS